MCREVGSGSDAGRNATGVDRRHDAGDLGVDGAHRRRGASSPGGTFSCRRSSRRHRAANRLCCSFQRGPPSLGAPAVPTAPVPVPPVPRSRRSWCCPCPRRLRRHRRPVPAPPVPPDPLVPPRRSRSGAAAGACAACSRSTGRAGAAAGVSPLPVVPPLLVPAAPAVPLPFVRRSISMSLIAARRRVGATEGREEHHQCRSERDGRRIAREIDCTQLSRDSSRRGVPSSMRIRACALRAAL